jgi:hypothetical protein
MSSLPTSSRRTGFALRAALGLAAACLCAACGATPFPGNPQSAGVRDVPFVDTYNFDFPTGAQNRGSKGGPDLTGNLRIYSAADLANLLSAANVSTEISGGVITGFTISGGAARPGVILQARDFDGKPLTDVFYNGLGGVPDFVATDGTADQGSFTIFNAPVGEDFILASGGGRGADHVGVFNQSISVKPVSVVPVIVSEIGITGPITDWLTGINVFPVELSALGLQKQSRFSDDRGLLQLAPLVGFRVVLPSNSTFTLKTETADYVTTYQAIDTSLADLGTAPDLTRFLDMVSEARVDSWYQQVGLTRQPGTGIVAGVFIGGQDTPQQHMRYGLYNLDGTPAGEWFYGRANLVRPTDPAAEDTFTYVVLNAPPGPKYMRTSGFEQTSGIAEPRVGGGVIDVFADAVALQDVDIATNGVPSNPFAPVVATLRGRVLLPDLVTPVTDVVIDVAGFPAGPGATDGPIRSQTSFVGEEYRIAAKERLPPGDPYDQRNSNLLVGSGYLFRVGDPPGQSRYVPTYQPVATRTTTFLAGGSQEAVRNLEVFPRTELESMAAIAGVTLDPGAGVVVGRVVDVLTASTVPGIELKVLNDVGDEVGEIRYVDTDGVPQLLDSTSSRGEFVAFNVPPGPVLVHVVSQDDTGSQSTRVYAGGVTVLGTMFIGDAPVTQVPLDGTVTDMNGTALGGAELTFRGEPAPGAAGDNSFLTAFSDGTGSYDVTVGVLSHLIVSTNAGTAYYTTHNHGLTTLLTPRSRQTVYALSRNHVAQIESAVNAAGGSLTQDPNLGIVVGDVTTRSWLNDPGDPTVTRTITEGIRGPTAIAKALLNGDGLVDLIVANGDSDSVSVYFGAEDGHFIFAGNYPVGANPVGLVGLDVDGDTVGDILVLSQGAASGEVTVLLGTVRGVFREDPSRRLLVGNQPVGIALGDMDGDGQFDDLVVLNGGGGSPTVSVFYRDDDRQFVPAPTSGTLLDGFGPTKLIVQDLDPIADTSGQLNPGNPLADITVVMEGSDTVETYHNSGRELFRQQPLFLASGAGPTDVVRVDLNGGAVTGVSRDQEYVVLNSAQNNVQVRRANVTNTNVISQVDLDAGCAARAFRLTETNGDGYADLVVPCSGNNTVTVYLGQGKGFFTPWQCDDGCPRPAVPTGDTPVGLTTDLLDPELGTDLAVINKFGNSMTVFYARPEPMPGVQVTVADVEGVPAPTTVYLDASGQPMAGKVTGTKGRFMAFNVPAGNAFISAVGGENANTRVLVRAGEASYTQLNVLAGSPASVTIQGQVQDAVASPQSDIDILFAGSGIGTTSATETTTSGVYEITLPSNQNEGVVRLRGP